MKTQSRREVAMSSRIQTPQPADLGYNINMADAPRVFISHTSTDKAVIVKQLASDLRNAGAEVFYDEWSIQPADRLRDKISTGIRRCTHFLVVISARSVSISRFDPFAFQANRFQQVSPLPWEGRTTL